MVAVPRTGRVRPERPDIEDLRRRAQAKRFIAPHEVLQLLHWMEWERTPPNYVNPENEVPTSDEEPDYDFDEVWECER